MFDAQCLYIRIFFSDGTVCHCQYICILEQSVVIAESLYFVLEPFIVITHCHCIITLEMSVLIAQCQYIFMW
jgi:hypothetical protein